MSDEVRELIDALAEVCKTLRKTADYGEDVIQKFAPDSLLKKVGAAFPRGLLQHLVIKQSRDDFISVWPKGVLTSDDFGRVTAIALRFGGHYVRGGKGTHFRIPMQPREEEEKGTNE